MKKAIIAFVTGNKGKFREFSPVVADLKNYTFVQKEYDLPEIQGEPEQIAEKKCRLAASLSDLPVITEDTSLCFNALKGLPGPYIKDFLKKLGHHGLYELAAKYPDQKAVAQCIFAFCTKEMKKAKLFIGRKNGIIVPPRTKKGVDYFGWDPIFQPEGFSLTYAEMDKSVKTEISHRGKAAAFLKEFLTNRQIII